MINFTLYNNMMDGSLAALSDMASQDEDDDSDDNFLYVQPAALKETSLPRFKEDPSEMRIAPKTDDLEQVESTYSNPSFGTVKQLKYSLDCIVQTNSIQVRHFVPLFLVFPVTPLVIVFYVHRLFITHLKVDW
ncbi:uncharacterized protein LOC119740078 [Patiria miniata]|uniref:Uncharacterized protein n=1 Tax=Patiria miniata TaxID=46514 RepID=A0A914B6X7_PATMI|nr:uncharacterized protein LOC119740078 [Patiria miniata]